MNRQVFTEIGDIIELQLKATGANIATMANCEWRSGRCFTPHFPLRLFLAFERDEQGSREELVVVSVDVQETESSSINGTCDIAKGDGSILLEGPGFSGDQAGASEQAAREWAQIVVEFIGNSSDAIASALTNTHPDAPQAKPGRAEDE